MTAHAQIYLASRSPRRAELLQTAGLRAVISPSDLDDGMLRHGDAPPEWIVMSLAYFKARRVADTLRQMTERPHGIVLGADTLCAIGRSTLGQPRDAADARRMLRLLREREHRTLTGIALLPLPQLDVRLLAFDAAVVRVGAITDGQIDAYVASESWRGKAGAYNLSERISDGWPITCLGDPATVMGLPMMRLAGWIQRVEAACRVGIARTMHR